jgi:hypothetical protein
MSTAAIPVPLAFTDDAAPFTYGTIGEPVAPLGPVPVALGAPIAPPVVALVDREGSTLMDRELSCRPDPVTALTPQSHGPRHSPPRHRE